MMHRDLAALGAGDVPRFAGIKMILPGFESQIRALFCLDESL